MLIDVGSYVLGAISTIIGSWIASKIRVYHDNRRLHHDDLKHKILVPIRTGLDAYVDVVSHTSPIILEGWGSRDIRQGAKADESAAEYGPLLQVSDPRNKIERSLDEALLADARENHHRQLISEWESFRDSWTEHLKNCEAWVSQISLLILNQSGLSAHPTPSPSPYVMHLRLAVFVYMRLFQVQTGAVRKIKSDGTWYLQNAGTLAMGTEEQIDGLVALLTRLIETEKEKAFKLREESEKLRAHLLRLSQRLSLAIASRKLPGKCSMVTFF